MGKIRLGLAQCNFTVGDLEGNAEKIFQFYKKALDKGVQVLAFPELALTGYPPEDLLLKSRFLSDVDKTLQNLAPKLKNMLVVLGTVHTVEDVYNSAAIISNGRIIDYYHKNFLPNYNVFDENRYFQSGYAGLVLEYGRIKIGVNICEDLWYPKGPAYYEALLGDAELIINLSSSPFHSGKSNDRLKMISTRAQDNAAIIAYVNTVGGQDELVFDGHSMVVSEEGILLTMSPGFDEDLQVMDVSRDKVFSRRLHDPRRRKAKVQAIESHYSIRKIKIEPHQPQKKPKISPTIFPMMKTEEEIYSALKLGLSDYVKKNNFNKVILGISGGIDSALVAAIAVDTLGKDNVIGISMPSDYTSEESKYDAVKLAENLGIEFHEIKITPLFEDFKKTLIPFFEGLEEDITEENLQARIRGNIIMAFSNKFGYLVLATGNKSETSVGYSTLYGDMAGGFSLIKDVPKTMVYKLSRWRNEIGKNKVIPFRIIEKAPSAELKPDQTDQDSLPPYDILDNLIWQYVEEDHPCDEIVENGINENVLKKVVSMINANEYKRRQSAPGIKITPRSFGKDRRMPITNRYREI